MRGYLLSKGFRISERNISSALKVVDPISYEERRNNSLDRTNPIPYRPRYYGHKLHVDQNEICLGLPQSWQETVFRER